MVSYKDEGSLKTTDPRHKEGDKIVMPQKSKTKSKEKLTDSDSKTLKKQESKARLTDEELNNLKKEGIEYLEQQRKEHMKDGSM